MVRGYVRFAAEHRPLFDTIFGTKLDGQRHPDLEAASRPVKEAFEAAALAVCGGGAEVAGALAVAVATTAHGQASMLHLGAFGEGAEAVSTAVALAGSATEALVAGRSKLTPPRPPAT